MSLKKFFCGALAASVIFSASFLCSAAPEDSANSKLIKIETDTYGAEQSGALLDRISRLEKVYSGQNMTGNMNARIDAIYDVLYDNDAGPSMLAKINALEWNLNHEVQSGGLDNRLATLERTILGKVSDGTINERINILARESFGAEILPIVQVPIATNTLVKVVTTIPVDSKAFQVGDNVPIKVAEDIFIDGTLVFAKGLPGEGNVTSVHRAKNIFSNGKIETDFHTLKAIDGQDAKIFTGVESIDEMNNASMARGLSLLGQTFSGKNKDIEAVLVRGKNVDLPAGIELYVQVKTPIVVYGVKTTDGDISNGNGGLSPDEMNITAPKTTEPTIPSTEPETILERVDTEPTTPTEEPQTVEPRPDEGKTFDGYDGEIIEIIDEE